MKKNVRALFILKRRQDYSTDLVNFTNFTVSTGMYNSASFVSDMLSEHGVESKVVVVIDNNDIDREVRDFNPTHVFIEGYWVVPEKFDVLKPLHPSVTWVIRCHSELPFLAQEGIAIQWTFDYLARGVTVSGNSPRINRELRVMAAAVGISHEVIERQIPLLTNFYPVSENVAVQPRIVGDTINVGCFGSHRPLKNHLIQALAAIEYANQRGLKLRFHVNSGRVEMNGSNGLKNLKALFANIKTHELVEHPWASHEDFLETVRSMDLCLQVSFTETFNIVTADAVNSGVPVVVSDEILWVEGPFADPTSTTDIVETMSEVMAKRHYLIETNRRNLKAYSKLTKKHWIDYLEEVSPRHGLNLIILNFKNLFF